MLASSPAESVLLAIGRTPVVRLRRVVPAGAADVLVKLESVQPHGLLQRSHGARDDRRRGSPRRASAGHAGRRIHRRQHRFIAGHGLRGQGLPIRRCCPRMPSRRRNCCTMQAFGAELRMVPSDGGKVTPGALREIQERDRGARERARHVLDRSVSQRGRPRRLHGHRPRTARSRPAEGSTSSAARSAPAACCAACRRRCGKAAAARTRSSRSSPRLRRR